MEKFSDRLAHLKSNSTTLYSMTDRVLADCDELSQESEDMRLKFSKTYAQTQEEQLRAMDDPRVQADAKKIVAELLAKVSALYLKAAALKTFETSWEAHKKLDGTLQAISGIAQYAGKELLDLMYRGHGVMRISLAQYLSDTILYLKSKNIPTMKFGSEELHWLQAYNMIHWGGIAEFYGVKPKIQGTSIICQNTEITFDEHGLIRLSPELIRQLIASTPHLVEIDLKDSIPINVSGNAVMSLPELFTLLRTASNSLHAITVGMLCSKMANACDNAIAVDNAIAIEAKRSIIRPISPEQLRQEISDKAFDKFDGYHLEVLMRAAGYQKYPNIAMMFESRYPLEEATLAELLSLPKRDYGLHIKLKDRMAVVTDTGIGSAYVPISQIRKGGRTSGFIQNAVADIERKIKPDGCTATVRFRRAVCG